MVTAISIAKDFAQMQDDANKIIVHRINMIMSGTMSDIEARKMVSEKTDAFTASARAGMIAAFTFCPLRITAAMLAPYHRQTTINVIRFKI